MHNENRLRVPPNSTRLARHLRHGQSPIEGQLWARFRNRNCGGFKFRRQFVIGNYIADFYCAEANLIVEVDGQSHNETGSRDLERDQWIEARGYHTLRVTNQDVVHNLDGVLTLICQVCTERSAGG